LHGTALQFLVRGGGDDIAVDVLLAFDANAPAVGTSALDGPSGSLVVGPNSDQGEVMARIDIAQDLVPIGEFKTHASQLLRKLHETGRPLVITQNGKASAVVLTPEEFEQLGYRQYVQQKVNAGQRSAGTKTFSTKQVANHLRKRIGAKAAEG